MKKILQEYNIAPSVNDVISLVGGGASLDVDLMSANGLAIGASTQIINFMVEGYNLAKKTWFYNKDKSNMIELGKSFMPGI